MKQICLLAYFLIGLAITECLSWSRPVDLSSPHNDLGAANSKGFLEIWRDIPAVGLDMGPDSYLGLRYKFTTDPAVSGILGPGFYLPMFEARNTLIQEGMMRAYLPCGKGLYLARDPVDPNKFQTADKQWMGILNGDGFTIKRDDGWTVHYRQGRLLYILTDQNHTFTWLDNGGVPTGVSEDGRTIISLETNPIGQVTAFVFDGKRYEVSYADRPVIGTLATGQTVVNSLTPALSTFTYPDGTTDNFKINLNPDLIPTLTFTDTTKNSTTYTWDAATGHIASEDGPAGHWKYQIGNSTDPSEPPSITRTNPSGKTETLTIDGKAGTYTEKDLSGTTFVTHISKAPGPMFDKVTFVEKLVGDQLATIYKASYDQNGKLIRTIDDRGISTSFNYDHDGKYISRHTTFIPDPKLLAALQLKEKTLLDRIKTARPQLRDKKINDLAIFYIFNMLDFAKAQALSSMTTNRRVLYHIQLMLIEGQPDWDNKQKLDALGPLLQAFPEQSAELTAVIQMHEGTYVGKNPRHFDD